MYKCGWNGCEKAYGTLNHLNAHVTMQSHGAKRTPEGMFLFLFLLVFFFVGVECFLGDITGIPFAGLPCVLRGVADISFRLVRVPRASRVTPL